MLRRLLTPLLSFGIVWLSSGLHAQTVTPFAKVQRYTLDNGLTIYHAQLPKAPFYKFSLYVWAGSVDETPGVDEGAAHFVEHLLFQGDGFDEESMDNAMDAMGGQHNAFTYRPYTQFYISLPKDHLAKGLPLLWQVVFNPSLHAEKYHDVLRVIDQENQWSDPTWLDRLAQPFDTPEYLQEPAFWQQNFGMREYDRKVGGNEKGARQLKFAAAVNFHQRFYHTANMTATYAGPHTPQQLQQILSHLSATNPGNTQGQLNQRGVCPQYGEPLLPFRRLQFNDDAAKITLGYLSSQLEFEDTALLNLYTATLNKKLYEALRWQQAETYSTEDFVESFRDCGYVAFRSQASRIRFTETYRRMREMVWGRWDEAVSAADFRKIQAAQLQFLERRLDNASFVDAYLGLLVREHPQHQPSLAQMDWHRALKQVSYQQLQNWSEKKLRPQQNYAYLQAPSRFIPFEIIPLLILMSLGTVLFWRWYFLRPQFLRGSLYRCRLQWRWWQWLSLALLTYGSYMLGLHLLYPLRWLLSYGLSHNLPLYLTGYLNSLLPPFVLLTCWMLVISLLPRRLFVTQQYVSWVAWNRYARALPIAAVQTVEIVHHRNRPLVRLTTQTGKRYLLRNRDPQQLYHQLKLAMLGKGDERQLRLFTAPGVAGPQR